MLHRAPGPQSIGRHQGLPPMARVCPCHLAAPHHPATRQLTAHQPAHRAAAPGAAEGCAAATCPDAGGRPPRTATRDAATAAPSLRRRGRAATPPLRRWRQVAPCAAASEEAGGGLGSSETVAAAREGVGGASGGGGGGGEEFVFDCVATGLDVECIVRTLEEEVQLERAAASVAAGGAAGRPASALGAALDALLLVSPFFFWGTAMVAMKDVLPRAGPLFVASLRLLPAGALLVAFAASRRRPLPSGAAAWLAIALFALVDGACFQGFLAEGLRRTSAGLGSVIIDSQPLTVAVLAALLFGESIGPLGALGLATGVVGLCLVEIPVESLGALLSGDMAAALGGGARQVALSEGSGGGLWDKGEWWMLLAAQSMAVGTIMVRWVCKYSDPIMATGWHMVLGGVPLLILSAQQHDPALSGHAQELTPGDWASLLYTSVFGSAVSYGVFFYNANKGNLTRLSSLTFLTPMFATFFGYLFLGETLNGWQLSGAAITLVSIYLVNFKPAPGGASQAKELK